MYAMIPNAYKTKCDQLAMCIICRTQERQENITRPHTHTHTLDALYAEQAGVLAVLLSDISQARSDDCRG